MTFKTRRIQETFDDPAASYWLRRSLNEALDRDPVDAMHDAERLVELLRDRFDAIMRAAGVQPQDTGNRRRARRLIPVSRRCTR